MTATPVSAPLRPSGRRVLQLASVAAVLAASLYCSRLDVSPLYLTKDEVSYGIQSHAIATTGRDINGRRFPVFFEEIGFSIGRDPLYIYGTALLLQFLPLDAPTLRLVPALAAAVSVGLVVLIAYEVFGSAWLAGVAGVLLAVTPVFFIRSRAALSVILPVPFQLCWLLFLLRYARDGRLRHIAMATTALGLGLYSYLSMMFFAPVHMLFSLAEIARQKQWRHAAIALAIFAALMLPIITWQLMHPSHFNDLASTYRIYPAELTPLQGVKDVLAWSNLSLRADRYWNAFNPSRLFFAGESSLVDSTRTAGLFPVVYLLLLPIGVYDLLRRPFSIPLLATLGLIVIAPATSVFAVDDTVARYLVVVPLAALLATGAIDRLWRSGWITLRAAAVAAMLVSVVLFAGFYQHYMGDWRINSAPYLGLNLQGAIARVMTTPVEAAPQRVYLSENIPYASVFWEFYGRALNRPDLIGRASRLRLGDSDWRETPGPAVAIVPGGADPSTAALTAAGWRVTAEIHEFYGGPPTFIILSRP
jgi:4-amino-4-deoxy-L-arabinose transferase-like glycosyltransferase